MMTFIGPEYRCPSMKKKAYPSHLPEGDPDRVLKRHEILPLFPACTEVVQSGWVPVQGESGDLLEDLPVAGAAIMGPP